MIFAGKEGGTLESVDVYTKQCSVGVTAKQLAMMGATLADFGANPITGEQVIKRENVAEILEFIAGLTSTKPDHGKNQGGDYTTKAHDLGPPLCLEDAG